MSYQSFTYDLPNDEKSSVPFTDCVVYFRPDRKWQGKEFGFDWVRDGETRLMGDISYAKNMGEYYIRKDGKDTVQTGINSYDGTFKNNPGRYEDLIKKYFNEKHIVVFKIPKKIKEHTHEWDADHERLTYTYFVPTMTLRKDKTASLELTVELAKDKNPPAKLSLEATDKSLFNITSDLVPKKGKYSCTVKCLAGFRENQFINVFAVYENDGKEEKRLCGRLRILANLPEYKAKILVLPIRSDIISRKRTVGTFNESEQQYIEKILNQAMIDVEFEKLPVLQISKNEKIKYPIQYFTEKESGNSISEYYKNGEIKVSILSDFFLWRLQNDYIKELLSDIRTNEVLPKYQAELDAAKTDEKKKEINAKIEKDTKKQYESAINTNRYKWKKYENMFKIICVDYAPQSKDRNDGTEEQRTGSTPEGAIHTILFNSRGDNTAAHELLHIMGIGHSFNAPNTSKHYLTKYTYRATLTDNLMDYPSADTTAQFYATWQWQWEKMREMCLKQNSIL